MRNHQLLTKLPGDLEHAVKCRCSKESILDEISTDLKEVRIRTYIGRYNNNSTGDNMENPTLEAKETHYADNSPKDREEIFAREEDTRKGHLTLIMWGMAVEIIHTVNPTPMRIIWWNLRAMQ
ncbi:hypothetical protein O181_083236 [Austropuccinia psidii MF-1]|uniref:Uncharacterized protein n=1 Tax=Austropuccinia psidii MF-1 TaxID=1389203 RepID=A0A9Q3IHP6_9BASI|nr:hypothetical protein [Austropuccinia psidii MF-1]